MLSKPRMVRLIMHTYKTSEAIFDSGLLQTLQLLDTSKADVWTNPQLKANQLMAFEREGFKVETVHNGLRFTETQDPKFELDRGSTSITLSDLCDDANQDIVSIGTRQCGSQLVISFVVTP